jgi:hypothetical protein
MPFQRSENPNPYYQKLRYWSAEPTLVSDYEWKVKASTHEDLISGVRSELSKLHKHLEKFIMDRELKPQGKYPLQLPQLQQAIRETQEWLTRNDTPEAKLRGNWPRNVRPRLDPSVGSGSRRNINNISNPAEVFRKFKKYKGNDDATIDISPRPDKKYVVRTNGRSIHFGSTMPDFTKHKDRERQRRYLLRALAIPGKWKNYKYSANRLAILLLWT